VISIFKNIKLISLYLFECQNQQTFSFSLVGCPYSDMNMSKDIIVPERLASSFLGVYVTSQDANPPAVASDTRYDSHLVSLCLL